MRRATAAAYLDLPATQFDRAVAAGTLPLPFLIGKAERWSKAALDRALAVLCGEAGSGDWRAEQPAYQGDWRKEVKAYRAEAPKPSASKSVEPIRTKAFSAETLSAHWGMSVPRIYKLFHSGELRGFRIGKLIRFVPAEVLAAEERLGIKR